MENDTNYVERLINKQLGKRAHYSNGIADAKVQYNWTGPIDEAVEFVIYHNLKYGLLLIWNFRIRRAVSKTPQLCFTVTKRWNEIDIEDYGIDCIYKTFQSEGKRYYEKVLVIKPDCLEDILCSIEQYMKPTSTDPGFPFNGDSDVYIDVNDNEREHETVSRKKRDYRFRKLVLARYGTKCAICRCKEEKLLEAAHRVSVAESGSDNPQNGICLCANHHIMFDRELIQIDFQRGVLEGVSNSVKCMSWYREFKEKYCGKIIIPN